MLQKFSGIDYIKIDIANHLGMDKQTWDKRINFVTSNDKILESLENISENKILYMKAVRALRDAQSKIPTGFIMGLDATASGIQIMACLMGCKTTAKKVNLIDTGTRQDVYEEIAKEMTLRSGQIFPRSIVKHPIMTTFYGSTQQPKDIFGDNTPELVHFYSTLSTELPGAIECMNDMQSCWQPNQKEHTWVLPDGHVAFVKIMVPVNKKIEIDELDHATFTYRAYINEPTDKGLSLAANIIHSIDGYVVREMIRKADRQNFEMLHIHDSFWASPNYMNEVRQNYNNILAEIAESDLLEHILSEIIGSNGSLNKLSFNLGKDIIKANYALS